MKKINCLVCDGCKKVIYYHEPRYERDGYDFHSEECAKDGRWISLECGHSVFAGWGVSTEDATRECWRCQEDAAHSVGTCGPGCPACDLGRPKGKP